MVDIPEITLCCIDTVNHGRASLALKKSLKQIKPARTIFLTNIALELEGIQVIQIPDIKSKQAYSEFVLRELYKYFDTSHVLVCQHDGYVLDGNHWNPEFLEYDFLGAPWVYEHNRNIANGGFSLRSKRLCEILATDPLIEVTHPEDQSIGILYRGHLEQKYGIKFPSEELADTFAFELKVPTSKTFGFHGYFHPPYQETVVIHRSAALGDVVQCEPILAHFHRKGCRVVLDTLPQFFRLYQQHYFKVNHPEEIDGRLLANAKRYDLDLSYESKPLQLHLKTYYEYCEVPEKDMELRNPSLSLNIEKAVGTKLFKKYYILHLAVRGQPGRNIQGTIDWPVVVKYLKGKGYDTIQIGGTDSDAIPGALQMMTPGEPFLMWVIRESDGFLGIDSGPSNIAVAFDIPSIIFFGSVEPKYIYADLSNIDVIQYENICRSPKCWSASVGCEGTPCVENIEQPPCVQFTTEQVLFAIDNNLKRQS